MYPRLFWERGVLGQLLYLEAHAVGIAATGIGCYFDDPGVLSSSNLCSCVLFHFLVSSVCKQYVVSYDSTVHDVLGLKGKEFQSLYHFTVGAPVEDKRITGLPPYPAPKYAR